MAAHRHVFNSYLAPEANMVAHVPDLDHEVRSILDKLGIDDPAEDQIEQTARGIEAIARRINAGFREVLKAASKVADQGDAQLAVKQSKGE